MHELEITEENVLNILQNLNVNKSTGPDNIPAILLRRAAEAFKVPLTLLLRRSYDEGNVPSLMKNANVTPLFKGGKIKTANHFRPISLTPISAKVGERLYKEDLEEFLDRNKILSEKQHGFRKNRSTASNLRKTWETVTDWADEGRGVAIVYTDFKKAFDSVPKPILLRKLENYGIRGKNLKWIDSFISDRTQQVVINGSTSQTKTIKTACPQGGVLSGILFSLYINDLPNVIEHSQIEMYADDAKIFAPIDNEDSVLKIQTDLDKCADWSEAYLDLNIKKCHCIIHLPKNHTEPRPIFKIKNTPIENKRSTSDLGVTITEDFKFHKQVDKVCNLGKLEVNRIDRNFISRSPYFLRDAFKTYVRPIIEYNNEIWNPVYIGDQNKLEKVQNKLTKLLNYGEIMRPDERNRIMNLESHQQRRLRGDLISIFKNFEDDQLFTKKTDSRTRGHSKAIAIRRARTDIKRHSLSHRSIETWNKLPESVVQSPSVNAFKSNVDKYFQRKK